MIGLSTPEITRLGRIVDIHHFRVVGGGPYDNGVGRTFYTVREWATLPGSPSHNRRNTAGGTIYPSPLFDRTVGLVVWPDGVLGRYDANASARSIGWGSVSEGQDASFWRPGVETPPAFSDEMRAYPLLRVAAAVHRGRLYLATSCGGQEVIVEIEPTDEVRGLLGLDEAGNAT